MCRISAAEEHKISTVENPAAAETTAAEENSRDQWYDDLDGLSDPPDAGEIDDNSSSSDFEDTYIKKKKKKKKVLFSFHVKVWLFFTTIHVANLTFLTLIP